ncbi:hypothetical protein B1748_30175 [Paenibacillus sp. MY03]|uniref:hypothetical protein n=1 Tax=Paenibacillus sp. MY03 TaxID=302980 RepID=UPI000B3BE758|nr:hypothetical protein [Paenibacillus sp. MY03]OUS69776.1 hypothetical protein B1748_30175 [Paenibacillus sp. MY03]
MKNWRTMSICLLTLFLTILMGCSFSQEAGEATGSSIILEFSEPETITDAGVQLSYDDVHEVKKFDNSFMVYKKTTTDSHLYLGSVRDKQITEYGFVGEETYIQDFTKNEESLFGRPMTLITGICGANCVENYLFEQVDGQPQLILRLSGHVLVADLNEDGENEVVMMQGSPQIEIHVYKRIGDQIMKVNLNEEIGTTNSVTYNSQTNVLEMIIHNETKQYRYDTDSDSLISL